MFRLHHLLLVCVFLSPLIPTAFGYPLVKEGLVITPTRMAEVLLLAAFFIVATTRRRVLRRHFPLGGVFLLYLGVRAAGLVFAPDTNGAWIQVLGEAGLFAVALSYLAFCVVRDEKRFEQLARILIAAGVLVSLAGLWEWVTQLSFVPNVMMPLVGVTFDEPQTIAMKIEIPRIMGTFDHPLGLAGFMVLLFPLALQRAILTRGAIRFANCVVVGFFAVSLFLAFSRIAQLAAILETLALLYIYRKRGLSWAIALGVVAGAIPLVRIYAAVTEGGDATTSLLAPWYTLGIIAERWRDLFVAFLSNRRALLIGFGYSRFDITDSTSGGQVALLYSRMDTDVLRILAVTGVIGFAAWVGIFHVFFRRLIRGLRRHPMLLRRSPLLAFGIGVAGALITTLPGVSILTYTQTWPVVAICIGAALGTLEHLDEVSAQGVREDGHDPALRRQVISRDRMIAPHQRPT